MNDFMNEMISRSSIRKYKPDQITDSELEQILHTAAYSPNAGNRQSTQIVVCQNSEINDHLGRIKKSLSRIKLSSPDNLVSSEQPSILDDTSIMSAFYNAPTVITLFAPKNFWFNTADCYIMANSICLAAHSIGIGSCIIGCVEDIFDTDYGKQILTDWKIQTDYQAIVHVTLGYPSTDLPLKKPRKYPNPIIIR